MSEATNPLADPARAEGWYYAANQNPQMDFASAAIGAAQDAFYKAHPKAPRHGHLWTVTKQHRGG